MNISFLPFVLLMVLLLSCQQQEKADHGTEVIPISKKEIKDAIALTTIVDEIRYVELETTEESLIGNVSKVIAYKDKIYIKDRFVASKIYIDRKSTRLNSSHV